MAVRLRVSLKTNAQEIRYSRDFEALSPET